jgi:hypothetical protein
MSISCDLCKVKDSEFRRSHTYSGNTHRLNFEIAGYLQKVIGLKVLQQIHTMSSGPITRVEEEIAFLKREAESETKGPTCFHHMIRMPWFLFQFLLILYVLKQNSLGNNGWAMNVS